MVPLPRNPNTLDGQVGKEAAAWKLAGVAERLEAGERWPWQAVRRQGVAERQPPLRLVGQQVQR